ncbi:hypothetical protein Gogos_016008 [Gossypium gossypioides]|uniref:Methylthioribose-1-phosphate isomerase n=1 Tax=Gossypium gossypioides TaxID=34282 RepID=A0A7J9B6E1_GOSGO|nr:hypothetical protein [Gossypium gossypioides]
MAPDSKSSNDLLIHNSLQSICYKRGSLQLLDQRKLPLETVYLDIQDATDGWNAIRDMVVRGAPAIAIAAALSLAVEVANFKDFNGTSEEAASFIELKLEYLVSSRPTALNLSDAAKKLIEITSNAASTTIMPESVFQAYIEAAEIMLDDDVASNKAIGSYGSRFLQDQQKIVPRFSVLTHCNTGSLATAGYGTALGVIRALHAEGVLERAYCTETRPFNQGSRLTAFELVHDKIPATLIADSAAAALMKESRLSAVIVGADRVAANGDTANKIGTYSLALCAMHHHIPFYVAAPLTSIDLSLSSGEEIVIEERSAKELLHSRGGLGDQVAASGILVWNPAFDVTPAYLITGIITEKVSHRTRNFDSFTQLCLSLMNKLLYEQGVITKNNDAFNIKDFVEKAAGKSTA